MLESQKDLTKFLKNNTGERYARQRHAYTNVINNYPSFKIYGFKRAIYEHLMYRKKYEDEYIEFDNYTEYKESFYYPHFLPDLYCITPDHIILGEIEDYSRFEDKYGFQYWLCDVDAAVPIECLTSVFGFNRYGEFERVLSPSENYFDNPNKKVWGKLLKDMNGYEEMKKTNDISVMKSKVLLHNLSNSYI